MTAATYPPGWYSANQSLARRSAQTVVPTIMTLVAPQSVVDVGCGTGDWLAVFAQAGVGKILGIDGGYVRQANLQIPAGVFLEADLTKPLALADQFDLAVCLEVAEHLPPEAGPPLIEQLARLAPVVLFSAAIPKQGGQDHRNEQWPEYWQALFEKAGFVGVDCLRGRFWDSPEVAWYYAQNMILFVQHDHLNRLPPPVAEAWPPTARLRRLVHPNRYILTANLEGFSLGQVLRSLPDLAARSIRLRWQRLTNPKHS